MFDRTATSNPVFLPRLEWAGRTALATSFICALAYGPTRPIPSPGYGAFVAILVIEQTLGRTTTNTLACIKGAVLASLFAKITQFVLSSMSSAPATLLTILSIAVSTYSLARAPLYPITRKVGLSLIPFMLVNCLPGSFVWNGESVGTGGKFVADLLVTTLVGCACALGAGLLPYPALASLRIGPKRATAGHLLAELLRSLGDAFVASEPLGEGSRSKVRRKKIARLLFEETAALVDLRAQATWNPLLGIFTPFILPFVLPDRNENVRIWGISATRKLGSDQWQLELSETDKVISLIDRTRRSLHVLEESIAANNARERSCSRSDKEFPGAQETVLERFQEHIRSSLRSFVDKVSLVLELNATLADSRLGSPVGETVSKLKKAQNEAIKSRADFELSLYAARRAIFYCEDPVQASKLTADSLLRLNDFIFNLHHISSSVLGEESWLQGSVISASTAQEQDQIINRAVPTSNEPTAGVKASSIRSNFKKVLDSVISDQAKGAPPREAVKITVAICIAALMDFSILARSSGIKQITITSFSVGYLCLGSTSCVGTSFDVSKQRAEGTVAGAVFASFVYSLHIGSSSSFAGEAVLVSCLTCAFVFAVAYGRGSPLAGHAGTVAAFTAPVLLLRPPNGTSGRDGQLVAASRTEQTIFAIFIWLLVEFSLWPSRASDSSFSHVSACLQNLAACLKRLAEHDASLFASSLGGDFENKQPYDGTLTVASLRSVSNSIATARKHISAAQLEPEFWRPSFPSTFVGIVVDRVEATLAHCITAHRALSLAISAPLKYSESCRGAFLLVPIREAVVSFTKVLAAAITAIANSFNLATSLTSQTAVTSTGGSADEVFNSLAALKRSSKVFYDYYDGLCCGLQASYYERTKGSTSCADIMPNFEVQVTNALVSSLLSLSKDIESLEEACADLYERQRPLTLSSASKSTKRAAAASLV